MEAPSTQTPLRHAELDPSITMLPVGAVSWPDRPEAERSFDPSFATKLAESIRHEGLHHPIQVKAVPGSPGRYEGVTGRHRHFAVADVLGLSVIQAKILADWQVEIAEQMTISENLFRSPLNKGQEALAIRRWHDAFKAEQSAPAGPGAQVPDAATSTGLSGSPATRPRKRAQPRNFAKHVAETTGRSQTAVKRSLAIGKAFTPEQLDVFTRQGTRQVWMETIAKEESEVRDAVVRRIADGEEPARALEAVTGGTHAELANGKTVTLAEVRDEDSLFDHELSDDQWLEAHCSDLMSGLGDPMRFRADALYFRHHEHILAACDAGLCKDAMRHPDTILLGQQSFFSRIRRSLNMAHPKHWRLCDGCKGTGSVNPAQGKAIPCHACTGGGYAVTQQPTSVKPSKANA